MRSSKTTGRAEPLHEGKNAMKRPTPVLPVTLAVAALMGLVLPAKLHATAGGHGEQPQPVRTFPSPSPGVTGRQGTVNQGGQNGHGITPHTPGANGRKPPRRSDRGSGGLFPIFPSDAGLVPEPLTEPILPRRTGQGVGRDARGPSAAEPFSPERRRQQQEYIAYLRGLIDTFQRRAHNALQAKRAAVAMLSEWQEKRRVAVKDEDSTGIRVAEEQTRVFAEDAQEFTEHMRRAYGSIDFYRREVKHMQDKLGM